MLFAWNNKETWAPLIAEVTGRRVRRRELAEIFRSTYEGILTFHGCRVIDVESYRKDGLLRSNTSALDARAREIFLSGRFPELTSEAVARAILDLGIRDEGRIFVSLDRNNLLERCGHYLIYGSERLCSIAAHLNDNGQRDYQQELKRHGKPTLLHVALPLEHVTGGDMGEFLSDLGASLAKIRAQKVLPESWFSFEFFDPLPGSAIINHEHPAIVLDPLHNDAPYLFRNEQQ